MSICRDDSNVFKYNFLKKLNNQTKKKSSKINYQSTSISPSPSISPSISKLKSKKQYNISEKIKSLDEKKTEKHNDELMWLKRYVHDKASELVEANFNQFYKLFNLFHSIRLDDFNIINPLQIKYHIPVKWMVYNLETELKKYPNRYLPYENRNMIINSLTENKTSVYTSFNLKYSFNKIPGLENLEGYIIFNCKFKDAIRDGSQYINNVIYSILRIIGFYVKYLIAKHKFSYKLPNIVIYFTDINKCLNDDGDVLGFNAINSAFYYGNNEEQELVIYRQQELFKILIHELQHFYRFDLTNFEEKETAYGLNDVVEKTYNVKRTDDKFLNPNEAYAEMNATVLNTIFSNLSFTKENLINNFYIEMLFSLYQISKLFNYEKIENSLSIYKNRAHNVVFRQKTYIFEYNYLKAKLLFQFNNVLNFINDSKYYSNNQNENNNNLINLIFPKPDNDRYNINKEFGEKLMINIDENGWDKCLNILIDEHVLDVNLRMTKLEIPLYNSKIKIKFNPKYKTF